MSVVNMMMPSYWIDLIRIDSKRVDAVIRQNIFFVVPIPTFKEELVNIIDSSTTISSPQSTRIYSHGSSRMADVESNGALFIKGKYGISQEIIADPDDISNLTYEVNRFIQNTSEKKKRIWVTASKKYGFYLPMALVLVLVIVTGIGIKMLITGELYDEV